MASVDILMITYDRPQYARLSLQRLLDTCDEDMRVWIWHNGEDAATLATVESFLDHPRVAEFHHSPENQRLTAPTNWLWENSRATFLSKVDDDCLVSPGWADVLRGAHHDCPPFGVVGSWRFLDEDFVYRIAKRKIRTFPGGHRLLENFWVQGSGYLLKRRCVEEQGLLRPGQSFTDYCIQLALRGYRNGWYYPFIREEHMDDPRSPWTGLRSDEDLLRRLPLSAKQSGIRTLEDWENQQRDSARLLQAASVDPRHYQGWRRWARAGRSRLRRRLRRRLPRAVRRRRPARPVRSR